MIFPVRTLLAVGTVASFFEPTCSIEVQRLSDMDDMPPSYTLSQSWKTALGRDVKFTVVQSNRAAGMPDFKYMTVLDETDQQQAKQQGVLEPFVSYHLSKDMQTCCNAGGRFLDVGGNFGWFALLGAATGCVVDSIEPISWFSALIKEQKSLNPSLAAKINVHEGFALGSENNKVVEMKVPTSGLMGAAGVNGLNTKGQTRSVKVPMRTVDALNLPATQPWCGMKVDVEGYEPDVFLGATGFLARYPQIIVIELSPGMTKATDPTHTKIFGMLNQIIGAGYTAHSLNWGIIKNRNLEKIDDSMRLRVQTDMNRLVSNCGFNCMVYFRRYK